MNKTNSKSFSRLTKAQKRVMIARDVIKQVKAQKYFAKSEIFAEVCDRSCTINQENLVAKNPACRVCAAGAAILSGIRLFNHEASDIDYIRCWTGIDMCAYFFGHKQTKMIEAAFEEGDGWIELPDKDITKKEFKSSVEFGKRFKNHTNLLVGIFKNIIRNRGTFRP